VRVVSVGVALCDFKKIPAVAHPALDPSMLVCDMLKYIFISSHALSYLCPNIVWFSFKKQYSGG
jgi:hypothetical protein